MSFTRYVRIALGLLFCSCTNETYESREIEVQRVPLEFECSEAPADASADVLSIMSSVDPFDPSQPQTYGSNQCAGFIFEFDNPDDEPLRGAWVQASGQSQSSTDEFSSSQCPDRILEADYWAYQDREWTKLAVSSSAAIFEPDPRSDAGYCHLEAVIEHPGSYEKLRIVARVLQRAETYPMYACLW